MQGAGRYIGLPLVVVFPAPASKSGHLFSHTIDDDVLHLGTRDEMGREGFFPVGHVDVLKTEIAQGILIGCFYVKEVSALHMNVSQCYVVASGQGHILSLVLFVELGPGAYHEERARLPSDVLNADIFVVLRCVGTHLEQRKCFKNFPWSSPSRLRNYSLSLSKAQWDED